MTIGPAIDPDRGARVNERGCRDAAVDHRHYGRIEQSLGQGQVHEFRGHTVLIGLGSVGMRVIEGLRRHSLRLTPNESGLSFDLEFIGTMNAHEETPHLRRR